MSSRRFNITRDDHGRKFATLTASFLEYESHLECTSIPEALRRALEDDPMPWIGGLLWGPTGVGKSYQAIRELRTGLAAGATSKFISIPRYIGELRDIASLSSLDEQVRLLRSAAVARYAVLDDLGAEKLTEFANEQLYLLVDGRASKGLSTLITGNLDISAIAAVHGDRIASRILGFSASPPRKLEGRDRRQTWIVENGVVRPKAKGPAFLRIAPRVPDDAGEDSQAAILEDLSPRRPRNGDPA
jgi:IstB-like ATP binding protein